MIIAIALAFGAGYGVYRVMKERRREAAIAEASAPQPRPAPPPREERPREPEPMAPVESPEPSMEVALGRAADPPESDRALVAFGTPGIDGPLQRYRVEQAMKTQKSKFTRCLALTAEMRVGMINIMLIVDRDGTIASKNLSPGGEPEFRKCVEEGLERVSFDAPERTTTIIYPIRFGRPPT